jgi:hypothetical protein
LSELSRLAFSEMPFLFLRGGGDGDGDSDGDGDGDGDCESTYTPTFGGPTERFDGRVHMS